MANRKIEVTRKHLGKVSLTTSKANVGLGHTAGALKDFIIYLEPNLQEDVERFVKEANEKSDHVLRAVLADVRSACQRVGISIGSVSDEQAIALVKGILDDRDIERKEGFTLRTVVWTGILSFLAALVTVMIPLIIKAVAGAAV